MTRLKAAYGASFSAAKQTALLLQTLGAMVEGEQRGWRVEQERRGASHHAERVGHQKKWVTGRVRCMSKASIGRE